MLVTNAVVAELPLMLALALAPFTGGGYDPGPGLWLACLVWLSLLLRLVLPGLPPIRRPSGVGVLAAFLLAAVVSAPTSNTPGSTLLQGSLYLAYGCLWVLAGDSAARHGWGRLLTALMVGTFLAGALGLQEYLYSVREGNAGWRSFGQFVNPNCLAAYLVPGLLITLAGAFAIPRDFQVRTWMLALACVTAAIGGALFATGSRGGLLSFGVGLLILAIAALLRGQMRNRAAWARLAVLLLVLGAVSIVTSGSHQGRQAATSTYSLVPPELCSEVHMGDSTESSQFRILTWKGTLAMALKRPLNGWGAGSFDTSYEPHAVAGYTRHAHSTYLQLFAEEGVLAPLAFVLLLLLAAIRAVRLPRETQWELAPGVVGAVAAIAVHNLFDSLIFFPAIALLVWLVLGLACTTAAEPNPREVAAEPAPAEVAGGRQAGREKKRKPAARRAPVAGPLHSPRSVRWGTGALAAAAALLATSGQAVGCALLYSAKGELRTVPSNAVESLKTAALLLPWDYRVADEQRRANTALGRWQDAIDAGLRGVRYAPDRAASYDFLAKLRVYMERPDTALETYKVGLQHTPNNVLLLYNTAELLEKQGQHGQALAAYRKIAKVEDLPIGKVRALGEFREYRFARARVALAAEADRLQRKDEALEHRRRAACLLAERRQLHDNNPAVYLQGEGWSAQVERSLRTEEEALWRILSRAYAERGDSKRARLSDEMMQQIVPARERLERLIPDIEKAMGTSGL